MQTLAVARGSDESVYRDLIGVGSCCILDHHFDQWFVAVLFGAFLQGLSCEHIVMLTIMDRIATTHVKLMLAVYLFVTIIACEVDGHGRRVVCSCVCQIVVVCWSRSWVFLVLGGGEDVFAHCARGPS